MEKFVGGTGNANKALPEITDFGIHERLGIILTPNQNDSGLIEASNDSIINFNIKDFDSLVGEYLELTASCLKSAKYLQSNYYISTELTEESFSIYIKGVTFFFDFENGNWHQEGQPQEQNTLNSSHNYLFQALEEAKQANTSDNNTFI